MTKTGRFGKYGGQYVPEIVMPALNELEAAYKKYKEDPEFQKEFRFYLQEYAGRPTRLYYADKLTKHYGKAKIFLKREDLLHTGAHKINVLVACGETCKTVPKISSIYFFAPGSHTEGDGWLYQNRSLSDTFVFPNGKDGKIDSIYADVDTTAVA